LYGRRKTRHTLKYNQGQGMNLEEHDIKKMGLAELSKYLDEQIVLKGKKMNYQTQKSIAGMLGISESTLRKRISTFRAKLNTKEVQESTPKNADFTEKELKVLKQLVKESEMNIKLFQEFQIYKELEKVPTDAETVRSAFNMSKRTTERLKKYSQVRRIPLQDLVELAVINMLDEYDKQ
jgi:DNA-binding protein Fis